MDEAAKQAIRALREGTPGEKFRAMQALKLRAKELIEVAIDLLSEEESALRETAAWLLAEAGEASPDVISALNSVLADSERNVRHKAAVALHRLGEDMSDFPEFELLGLS